MLGEILWAALIALSGITVYVRATEGNPTPEENEAIMESLNYRSSTFLTTDRAKSQWGQD